MSAVQHDRSHLSCGKICTAIKSRDTKHRVERVGELSITPSADALAGERVRSARCEERVIVISTTAYEVRIDLQRTGRVTWLKSADVWQVSSGVSLPSVCLLLDDGSGLDFAEPARTKRIPVSLLQGAGLASPLDSGFLDAASNPKLRLVWMPRLLLACAFAPKGPGCPGYFRRVSGMGAAMRSKAWRWRLVGSVRTGTAAGVPAKRSSLRVRVPRWSRSPGKLR